jgi:hypothetical protein
MWTPERRALQAALIRLVKPWSKSTGPRTAAGKAVASKNARRPDSRREVAAVRAAVRGHLAALADVQKRMR